MGYFINIKYSRDISFMLYLDWKLKLQASQLTFCHKRIKSFEAFYLHMSSANRHSVPNFTADKIYSPKDYYSMDKSWSYAYHDTEVNKPWQWGNNKRQSNGMT